MKIKGQDNASYMIRSNSYSYCSSQYRTLNKVNILEKCSQNIKKRFGVYLGNNKKYVYLLLKYSVSSILFFYITVENATCSNENIFAYIDQHNKV